jgi:PII-like signaling protein
MQHYQPAKLLRLHLTERDRHQGKPLYEAIVETCRELDIAGATVFRGLEGYGESAEIHRPHVFGNDLPIVIQVVDSADNIARLLPVLEEMMDKGLIALSDVSTLGIHKPAKVENV